MNDEQTTETSVSTVLDVSEVPAISEAIEEVTEVTETTEASDVYIYDEYEFYSMMYNSFEDFRLDNTEQNELIVYDMNRLAKEVEEYQLTSMILQMLTCGFIGVIIGVCLVNIFKKR